MNKAQSSSRQPGQTFGRPVFRYERVGAFVGRSAYCMSLWREIRFTGGTNASVWQAKHRSRCFACLAVHERERPNHRLLYMNANHRACISDARSPLSISSSRNASNTLKKGARRETSLEVLCSHTAERGMSTFSSAPFSVW